MTELNALGVKLAGSGLQAEDDFVVVQGVVDLAVILEEEIWVVDFKSDHTPNVAGKAREYEPQLRLYALALERIYGRPVREGWLYFLAVRRAVGVTMNSGGLLAGRIF